ncbi:MAG TPA: hypothetical protein VM222_04645, partial [Planctomycetota bacterium]|nr:hypothetical protein [Planctomycetota bacterium]
MKHRLVVAVALLVLSADGASFPQESVKPGKRPLPKPHPRLFGSAEQILALSKTKSAIWSTVLRSAESGAPLPALRGRTRG